VPALARPLLSPILRDEGLTRGLGDPEARILVEWLVECAEELAMDAASEELAEKEIEMLCRRGRSIARFVFLWSTPGSRGGAAQLAAVERFTWPLPPPDADACEVMQAILVWETEQVD
jgi:hypothetical protein